MSRLYILFEDFSLKWLQGVFKGDTQKNQILSPDH